MGTLEILYQVNLSYACYGIIVKDNIVIDAAPIAKWMIGKTIDSIIKWVGNKNGKITKID